MLVPVGHIKHISARLLFFPGGPLPRRLDLGRLSGTFYGTPSCGLPFCLCRDTV